MLESGHLRATTTDVKEVEEEEEDDESVAGDAPNLLERSVDVHAPPPTDEPPAGGMVVGGLNAHDWSAPHGDNSKGSSTAGSNAGDSSSGDLAEGSTGRRASRAERRRSLSGLGDAASALVERSGARERSGSRVIEDSKWDMLRRQSTVSMLDTGGGTRPKVRIAGPASVPSIISLGDSDDGADASKHVVELDMPGLTFGDVGVVFNMRQECTVEAVTPSQCLVLQKVRRRPHQPCHQPSGPNPATPSLSLSLYLIAYLCAVLFATGRL